MLLPPILTIALSHSFLYSCSFSGKASIWLDSLGWLFLNSNLNNHLSLSLSARDLEILTENSVWKICLLLLFKFKNHELPVLSLN